MTPDAEALTAAGQEADETFDDQPIVGAKTRCAARLQVTIVDVKGLYLPGHPDSSARPAGTTRAAGYKQGYKSEDGAGRIYLNHDLDGKWKKDTQLVEVTVKVTVLAGELPRGARIRWRVKDPDDPFNERPDVHPEWGRYIDGNDYGAEGAYAGPEAGDNHGVPDHQPRWEKMPGFALSGINVDSAETALVGFVSKVRIHLSNVAGDNAIVRAEVVSSQDVDAAGDETGVMTLWHRLDVEHLRMTSAFTLPVADVPSHFLPAFVQLDIARERVIPDRRELAPSDDKLEKACTAFVNEVFSHRKDPGWFCLISAIAPHPLPKVRGGVVHRGRVTLHAYGEDGARVEYFDIPGHHRHVEYAKFEWENRKMGFWVSRAVLLRGEPAKTRIWLSLNDVTPLFTAGDGSTDHAYLTTLYFSPRARYRNGEWAPPGHGIPREVVVEVRAPGATFTAGISPTIDLGKMSYFAGRTIVFSAGYADKDGKPKEDYEKRVKSTIVHELVHAFGMPHKCGYYDYRTPREKTCCMNYFNTWVVDGDYELIPGTEGKNGDEMCGRHIKQIRLTHLEDNGGLRWR